MLWSGWSLILVLISNSSIIFSKLLGTSTSAPNTISIIDTLVFHSFFSGGGGNFVARSNYLSIFSLSFIFTLWSARAQNSQDGKFSFFLVVKNESGLLSGGWGRIIIIIVITIPPPSLSELSPLQDTRGHSWSGRGKNFNKLSREQEN